MGLQSALSTALTGLTAAETQLDVVGNNLANSQTVGFKSSTPIFATQFLQTQGLGSSPTADTGGTNPRQTGLGVQVSEITPDFTQGTIEPSSSPSDLAIQGDGFFMVEGTSGETLYTRNGVFKTNSENELVTSTGDRLLGYGIDESFNIQTTELSAIEIPLGAAAVAQATEVVEMEGTLSPEGDIAVAGEVISSSILGDDLIPRPDINDINNNGTDDGAADKTDVSVAIVPDSTTITSTTGSHNEGGGGDFTDGDVYQYRFTFVDQNGTETLASNSVSVTVADTDATPNNSSISLTDIPESGGVYQSVNVYRTAANGSDFFLLTNVADAAGTNFVDDNSVALSTTPLDSTQLDGNYTYFVTFARAGEPESRPSLPIGPKNVTGGRVYLDNLPEIPTGPGIPAYDTIRIYRNLADNSSQYFLVDEISPGDDYIDSKADAIISDLSQPGNKEIDLDGPRVSSGTLLTDVVRRDGFGFDNLFEVGTLSFASQKGGRTLDTKEFTITADSTVQDLLDFMSSAMGIQDSLDDPLNPIPSSENNIIGGNGVDLPPGGSIVDGRIQFVSNNGVDSALSIGLSGFRITKSDGEVLTPNLGFGTIQDAIGESAVTDFIVYDTLGIPIDVRVTTVLENTTGDQTVYRWFADSGDNDPTSGSDISVGTGLVYFDGEGNFISASNDRISIERRNVPSQTPLEFQIDFSEVSGLATGNSTVAASRQDGSSAGTLTSYIIGEDGVVRGVFSNGVSRDLGQIRLARFPNNAGLEQRGQNLFSQGVNSGLPIEGNPGGEGIGTIISGALELSNTDIGANLLDLVLATTQYRGNSRVISTAQQLLDELLNLRR
ncbi:MAG: flagellar hook-basal body complex protein [Pirellulaceae bacterium]|nr:flagellar hook-basal body complex protein [Pirellulaceae bacterium]